MTESPGPDGDALAAALAAEYAAIFAYGPIGVRLAGDRAVAARQAEAAHRERRDALLLRLHARGTAPSAAASYALPFEITNQARALELAIQVEENGAAVWRTALSGTEGEERRLVLNALVDCAVRATGWRAAAGVQPVTEVFPGHPR